MVEGYIYSIPQKGYFAARLDKGFFSRSSSVREARTVSPKEVNSRYMDTGIFNFTEWRKIYTQVLDDYRHRLLLEGDPQGEHELRKPCRIMFTVPGVFGAIRSKSSSVPVSKRFYQFIVMLLMICCFFESSL